MVDSGVLECVTQEHSGSWFGGIALGLVVALMIAYWLIGGLTNHGSDEQIRGRLSDGGSARQMCEEPLDDAFSGAVATVSRS